MEEEKKKRKTTTSSAVKRKYNKKAYDAATAYVKKGQLAFLKQIAEEHPTIERDGETVKNFNDFPAPTEEDQEN